MEVINPRAALLSNYEVLDLLRELESDHIARTKTALRVKKEEEAIGHPSGTSGNDVHVLGEASENLRTMEVEAIQYLSADYMPTRAQTSTGITQLVKDIAPYGLTKGEKLQVVNLAPTLPVELYVIVEELEDRLGDRMEEVLSHVKAAFPTLGVSGAEGTREGGAASGTFGAEIRPAAPGVDVYEDQWMEEEVYREEFEFDDTGEGAGVEGDLDVEEE